jgi:hypothetical protein
MLRVLMQGSGWPMTCISPNKSVGQYILDLWRMISELYMYYLGYLFGNVLFFSFIFSVSLS